MRLTESLSFTSHDCRITGASLDLVRTAKLVLEEYFSLGDTVNDMNKVLLKDTKPTKTMFQVGPPSETNHRSAFEVNF